MAGQGPSFDGAFRADEHRIGAQQPADGITDMQQMGNVGAKGTHLRRWQIITFHSERVGVFGEGVYRRFDVVRVSEFIIRIDEDDVFAGSVERARRLPSSMLRPLSSSTIAPYLLAI